MRPNLFRVPLFLVLASPLPLVSSRASAAAAARPGAVSAYIDVHSHLDANNPERAVQIALGVMPQANAAKIIFMPSPFSAEDKGRFDVEKFRAALAKHPEAFAYLGGGGTLNPLLQDAATTPPSAEAQRAFRAQAEQLLQEGAIGFGEISAEHIPSPSSPSYSSAPPDGPLFLILADVAAQHDVPICLHMEAVPADMPLPAPLKTPPNPPKLKANIPALERLLAHNRRAKIVWAHMGSTDNYGTRTPDLCRRLVAAHSNLYMEIKVEPVNLGRNPLVDADGKIVPGWLKLLQDYPDRFLIGSDQNYPAPLPSAPSRWQAMVRLFNQLPAELRQKIGSENPTRLYFSRKP